MERDIKKYYVPELEEFHIGFEYEKEWSDGSWSKETLEVNELKDIEEEMLPITRVKYLDREDIESLGIRIIKEDEETVSGMYTTVKNGVSFEYQIIVSLDSPFEKRMITIVCEITGEVMMFWIKSKADLKFLLRTLFF